MGAIHHSAICVSDVEESLRFWRDGIGFEVLMDHRFDGDWQTLLNAPGGSLRAVFLGDPSSPSAGIVELVDFNSAGRPQDTSGPPKPGFLLLSVMTDVVRTLERLGQLALGGTPRRVNVAGIDMAVVVDPDGVLVELVDSKASQNLEKLSG
jgi:catechol 2,3-dioxygenase-like lactoylglutathione lyase family enzyme